MFVVVTAATATAVAHAQPAPDVVVLDELVAAYDPVPFDHKAHAAMAEMWDGCETCHHRTPVAATAGAATQTAEPDSRADAQAPAAGSFACKSCHAVAFGQADIRMPNLKGAYHRQCLNCHRGWANENACSACHRERKKGKSDDLRDPPPPPPTVDDIVGRMHPPIPEPVTRVYQARFTPAVGSRVLFRHKEHTARYGLKCSSCHHRDNCSNCHAAAAAAKAAAPQPVRPGRTWKDSHRPCTACHERDRCRHCHYEPGETPPPTFEHRVTGLLLDDDHARLPCGQCHTQLKSKVSLTCGEAACHRRAGVAFPLDRPGTDVATRPAVQLAAATAPAAAGARPATRPFIRRVRRGGS